MGKQKSLYIYIYVNICICIYIYIHSYVYSLGLLYSPNPHIYGIATVLTFTTKNDKYFIVIICHAWSIWIRISARSS